jgi:hypothetical protein
MTTDGKLYVKSTCLVCRARVKHCLYCNEGYSYIEAADTVIKKWLQNQTQEVVDLITGVSDDKK